MEKRKSDTYRHNVFAVFGWGILLCVIAVAYLLEVIKGERTVVYYVGLLAIGIIPWVVAKIAQKKSPEAKSIRWFVAFGFIPLYIYVLFTGDTPMTYSFAYPMLAVIIIFPQMKVVLSYGCAVLAAIIGHIIINVAVYQQATADDIADYEIEFFAMAIAIAMASMACIINQMLNAAHAREIASAAEHQEDIINQVVKAADVLSNRVEQIDGRAKDIQLQSESAQESIEQIAAGTADVASTVQTQQMMSNDISDGLDTLTAISEEIQAVFNETHSLSQDGIDNINALSQSSQMVAESKDKVSVATESLMTSLQEARQILSIIRDVTDQTTLLSLNASIEAARAGEQGKGFAVVASEIQKLSGDTAAATEKIAGILETLSAEANNVNSAVNNLDEVSERQNQLITATEEQFRVIDGNISTMTEQIAHQGQYLERINENNMQISDSISNTSAYTQELTASSENTMNLTKESLEGTRSMAGYLSEILSEVQELRAMTDEENDDYNIIHQYD